MKNKWSKHWRESKQPRKQRKYRYNAPLHVAREFLNSHLSRDLRKKYGLRAVIVRKGDRARIMRGQFKGRMGAIENVDVKNCRIAVEGATYTAREGKKKPYLIHPSNIIILELNLEDRKRKASIERAGLKQKPKEEKHEGKTKEMKE